MPATTWPTVWGGMPPFGNHPDRACKNTDPDVFFPDSNAGVAAAKAICRGCPLQWECGTWAVPQPTLRGVWGGLSEPERLRRRVSKPAPARKTPTEAAKQRAVDAGRAAAAARVARNLATITELDAAGLDVTEIMARSGHSRRTVHRYLRQIREARQKGAAA